MPHLDAALLRDRLPTLSRTARARLLKALQRTAAGRVNTWDYQWLYSILFQRGLCVNPRVNLVRNIGFDAAATHTTQAGGSPLAQPAPAAIGFPLRPPARLEVDEPLSRQRLEHEYKRTPLWQRLRRSFAKRLARRAD